MREGGGGGEACVAEEDGVFVGRVAAGGRRVSFSSLIIVWRFLIERRTYAWARRTRPNRVTRRERKLMAMRWSIGVVLRSGDVPRGSDQNSYPEIEFNAN